MNDWNLKGSSEEVSRVVQQDTYYKGIDSIQVDFEPAEASLQNHSKQRTR